MNKRITLIIAAFFLLLNISKAQVTISNISQTYSENFNSLASTGTTGTALPAGWFSTVASYKVGDGSLPDGGLYSFGTVSSSDRALGSLGSSSSKPSFGVQFVNSTALSITSITLNFATEQWRLGQKPALRLDSTVFSFNIGVDSLTATGWINFSEANLYTVDTTNAIAGTIDGNLAKNRKSVGLTKTGLAIPPGSNFWLKWTELNVSGSDDGLALDDLSVSFTGAVIPACTEPTTSVTNVVLNATSTTEVAGSFPATSPASDGYLVLLDSNATVPTIVDATTYTVGTTVGTALVVSKGASTTFSKSGLVSNTIYHAYVFPYNNSGCTGGPNYKTSAPGNDTAKTQVDACPEPTNTPTNLTFEPVGNNNINGRFTRSNPPADGYVVVFSLSSNIAYPLDSAVYNVGDSINYNSFKSKVADISSSAMDTIFSITSLTQATKYYVAVIPYNLCGGFKNFKRSASNGINRGDTTTTGTPPLTNCGQPTGVSSTTITNEDSTTSTISIKWRNSANGDSVLVFAAPFSTIGNVTLRDSAYYMVGGTVPSNGTTPPKVYYRGTDSVLTLTGLTINTLYKIFVVAFNNKGCLYGPNYGGLANTIIRTAAGTDCQNPSGVSNTSIIKIDSTVSTISLKWTNAVSDSVLVIAGPTATIGFVTLRDSAYYAVSSTIPGSGAKVYYRGTDSSTLLTGLLANTVYKIIIVPFNNKSCTFGPNYASGYGNITIRTALTTGVKYNNAEAEFSIFPNPTSNGSLFVKFKNNLRDDAVIEVIDIIGRKVSTQKFNAGSELQTIDVSTLAKGTYLLNVIYKGSNNVSTFIVE